MGLAFSSFISIDVIGGLVFEPSEDGTSGTNIANSAGVYSVEKLKYTGGQWEWVPQTLTADPDAAADSDTVLLTAAQSAGLAIDTDSKSYTVTSAEANVDISKMDLGTAYRVKYEPTDTSADTEYSAFFTPPESVKVTASIDGAGSEGEKGVISVEQEYGAYVYQTDVNQEYKLQLWDNANSRWIDASGWYSAKTTVGSATDTTLGADSTVKVESTASTDGSTPGTVEFTGLDEKTGVYRVISQLSAGGAAIVGGGGGGSGDTQVVSSSTGTQTVYGGQEDEIVNLIPFAGKKITIPSKLDGKTSDEINSLLPITLQKVDASGDDEGSPVPNGSYLTDGKYYVCVDGEKTEYYVEIAEGTPGTTGLPTYDTDYYDGTGALTGVDDITAYEYFTVTISAGELIDSAGDFGIWDGATYVDTLIVPKGTTITLAASADSSAAGLKWTDGSGNPVSISGGTITVNATLNLTASGIEPSRGGGDPVGGGVQINTSGGGIIEGLSGSQQLKPGETATITVKPDSGKKLLDILVDGDSKLDEMKGSTLTVIGTGSQIRLDAIFTAETNAVVTMAKGGIGGGSTFLNGETADKSTSGLITAHVPGTKATLHCTPDSGSFLRNVIINGVSYGAAQVLEIEITDDMTIVPLFAAKIDLNDEDHFAYIIGSGEGYANPEGEITREEVATIFFRLLTDESRTVYMSSSNGFKDVAATRWSNTAISTLASAGIVTGKTADIFDPTAKLTRGEFATMASRFSAVSIGKTTFTDIGGHWAEADITNAFLNGWINGFTDGTFRPNSNISRAEVMAICNRILERNPASPDDLHEDMTGWKDNSNKEAWYYLDVQEATNAHFFERRADGSESWTQLRPNFDWSSYER